MSFGMRARVSVALAAAAALATSVISPAQAYTEPPRPAFYEAPATLPAVNGSLIRTEPATFKLDPLNATSVSRTVTRVLYKSTNRAGKAVAVSGTVFVPKTPWLGLGKRPIIGYGVGTQGMADRCAPSRQFAEGFEYEGMFIEGLLLRGYAVAMTDYEGLGTAGTHTYMDRVSQGRAVLDVVRAAQKLPNSGLTADNPVGLTGYSQGGGSTASAAELAATYAPELKIKGAAVGAVPANLAAVAKFLDGSMWSVFGLYAAVGLAASYNVDSSPYFNDRGKALVQRIHDECVFDLFKSAFTQTSALTTDGSSSATLLAKQPFAAMIEAQRIGRTKPNFPVLVDHSALDDTIPHAVGKQLAKDWCSKGANVRFSTNLKPLHVGGMLAHTTDAFGFFEARFAGLPQLSNCWTL